VRHEARGNVYVCSVFEWRANIIIHAFIELVKTASLYIFRGHDTSRSGTIRSECQLANDPKQSKVARNRCDLFNEDSSGTLSFIKETQLINLSKLVYWM
jgi:hypothetical protein